jgi:hypothetical protein
MPIQRVTAGKGAEHGLLSEAQLLQFVEEKAVPAQPEPLTHGPDGLRLLSGGQVHAPEVKVVEGLLRFLFQSLETKACTLFVLPSLPCQAVAEVGGEGRCGTEEGGVFKVEKRLQGIALLCSGYTPFDLLQEVLICHSSSILWLGTARRPVRRGREAFGRRLLDMVGKEEPEGVEAAY